MAQPGPSARVSRREEERKKSLGLLSRIAHQATPPPPPSAPAPPPRPAPLPAKQPAARAPAPAKKVAPTRRAIDPAFEGRRAKQEEERRLRQLRKNTLVQNQNLEWRGMDHMGVPASIRRTGFDRVEPGVQQKIQDILGEAREKEGRAKNRDRGRRAGGGAK